MDRFKVFLTLLLVAAGIAVFASGTTMLVDSPDVIVIESNSEKASQKATDASSVINASAPAESQPATDNGSSANDKPADKKPGNKKPGNKKPGKHTPKELDPNKKYVALTFDDGPHDELTKKFADKLAEYDGVGTFFVVGNRIYGAQEEGMKYAYDLGNEIGVHAWTHDYYYNTCSESTFYSELTQTADKIQEVTGEYPLTMRPVGGGITDERIASSGFVVINWNIDTNDWRYSSSGYDGVSAIYSNVMDYVDGNDIILFHEIYYNSYDAFCQVIDELHNQGYEFVTVSQLLQLDESDRGTYYTDAD